MKKMKVRVRNQDGKRNGVGERERKRWGDSDGCQ